MHLLEKLRMIADRQPREPVEQLQGSVNPRLAGRLLGRGLGSHYVRGRPACTGQLRGRFAPDNVVRRILPGRIGLAGLRLASARLRVVPIWLRVVPIWLRVISARPRLVLHPLHHSLPGPRGQSGYAATASMNATARRRQAVAPGVADVPPVA
jgi:hypothetical protein